MFIGHQTPVLKKPASSTNKSIKLDLKTENFIAYTICRPRAWAAGKQPKRQ